MKKELCKQICICVPVHLYEFKITKMIEEDVLEDIICQRMFDILTNG